MSADVPEYSPMGLVKEGPDGTIGVAGELAKVTSPLDIMTVAGFECSDCSQIANIPQSGDFIDEPYECGNCDGKRFELRESQSTFESYCKVRIEAPPDESGGLQNEYIDGFVQGDLVWEGHEDYGLIARSGEPVEVQGHLEKRQKTGRGENKRLFDTFLNLEEIEFEAEDDEVDIEKYRDEFEALAADEDAVDNFAESLVPDLYATPEWETALELLVAYLFAAPRLDIPNGPTKRGDIHALIISDYGMGKSMTNAAVALFSPKCIKESVTGMSSDVSLLAAAVEDDFGEGQWTLKPGILVRANGGHVILDEIDKTDADLERMNDALEGEQVVDVNKAGQRATYKSRVGLLATGNPNGARFDPEEPISEQMGLDQSLLSRFDGIVTMTDKPDEEQDSLIAEAQGMGMIEAQEYLFGDRDELDLLDRVITPEVGRAWIADARESCEPLLQEEHVEKIKEWYATEARQLNKKFASSVEEGAQMPVPVTPRAVDNTLRFSVAFARVHLRDKVADADVERAIKLSKKLVGQQFDGEKFVPEETRLSRKKKKTQRDEYDDLKTLIESLEDEPEYEDGVPISSVKSAAGMQGISSPEHKINKLRQKGELYEPTSGKLLTT